MIREPNSDPLNSNCADNYVGYKHPPKAHQFKKGQSGNPKGRTKKSGSMKTFVQGHFGKKMTIKVGGKPTTVPTLDALMMQMLQRAFGGNQGALNYALGLAERYMVEEEAPEPVWDLSVLTDSEFEIFERLLSKVSLPE